MHHTIIVKASYQRHGNVAPKDVAAEAARLGITDDGGGMVIGQRSREMMYEHWFIAHKFVDAQVFHREVKRLGYEAILIED